MLQLKFCFLILFTGPYQLVDLKDSEEKLIVMLDAFENHDDVQDVTSNANLSE